jgi:hypothetical protein
MAPQDEDLLVMGSAVMAQMQATCQRIVQSDVMRRAKGLILA